MTGDHVQAALWAVVDFLDNLGIPYALMGALVLGFYGEGRATRDVDLLIDADGETLRRIRQLAVNQNMIVDDAWSGQNPGLQHTHLRLIHSGVPVDIMAPREDHDRSACLRRRIVHAGDRPVWVVSPEDFILQK